MECEDGHEGYLMDLAREVDNRISGLRSKSGEISDYGADGYAGDHRRRRTLAGGAVHQAT
jgi:hypothetical protein